MKNEQQNLNIKYVAISDLHPASYNPRKWNQEAKEQLKESIKRFGLVDPFIVNSTAERPNTIIGGHFRWAMSKELGFKEVPVVYIDIPDLEKEKELNLRLNKNQGEFDLNLLAEFDESFLADIGFNSEDLDKIFEEGDIYELDGSRLMCGDSTIEADMLKLVGTEKIDMVMTDPPYILDYLHGKTKHGEATTGFGSKKNRRYLETESLPDNFTELWMNNVAKVQADNFSIIVYENWKNIRIIWGEMEKHWKVRNMLIWHLPNRNQGYASKNKFFSKYDIAMVGTNNEFAGLNQDNEDELLENEYESALFAISGKPQWESYEKGKKYCPTDFIEFKAADEKSSGQSIIFGTKPLDILIPYIKVLTKRDQLVLEPFGGSGSSLMASVKLSRRCFLMEKSPVYAEVILNRWAKLTGKIPTKIN